MRENHEDSNRSVTMDPDTPLKQELNIYRSAPEEVYSTLKTSTHDSGGYDGHAGSTSPGSQRCG